MATCRTKVFRTSITDTVSYDMSGIMSVKFPPGIAKQAGNPILHVKYDKPLAIACFDVINDLDVKWNLKYGRASIIQT